jgi:hypothetical protein
LERKILSTQETFANYYDRIRSEIETTLQERINALMLEKQRLFTEINSYQTACEKHFKDCDGYKQELHSFLKEAEEFRLKWANILPKSDENGDVLNAFKEAYAYMIELERKKIQYESFIFDKKLEFRRQESPIKECEVGRLCHIVDRLPPFDQWKEIDLKRNLFLHFENHQTDAKKSHLTVEEFESKRLLFCYVQKGPNMFDISKIKLVVTDENGFYMRSISEDTFANEFRLYKFKV